MVLQKTLTQQLLRNRCDLLDVIRKNIRTCSSVSAQYQLNDNEEDQNFKLLKIPASAYDIKSQPIAHEPDVGVLFKADDLHVRLASPMQLQPKPDADALSFGKQFTDHMLKIFWHKSLGGWQTAEITPIENLVIHPAAKVLHYAVELFEGMKAYRGVDDRIRLFRPNMNMNRMNLSAQRCGLPSFEGDEFVECLKRLVSIDQEWVPHSEAASLYIRPTLIGIDPTLGIGSSDSAMLYTILSPVGGYFSDKSAQIQGVSLMADPRFTRAWPGGVGDRKMGSNYAPTIHVQREAAKQGLQQVLWLYGDDHELTEAGTMNIFMLFVNENGERELLTPALNGLILPGITRDSILQLAKQWGDVKVTEGKITMKEICKMLQEERLLEFFGAGTACVVSPVDRISYLGTDLHIPTLEQESPFFDRVRTTLLDIQYGKIDHPWAVAVD